MYIITSKLNRTFGTIGKATGVKMTGKAVGKKKNFCVGVKNNLNKWSWSKASLQNFEQFFSFKIGFFASASFSWKENLLLLKLLVHLFHLAPCIREF